MDFAEPVTFMQLAALGERLPAAGSRCGACVTALLRRSRQETVTMPLTPRPAIAAPAPSGSGNEERFSLGGAAHDLSARASSRAPRR